MSVCSLRWFAEDMLLPAAKWLVRETADEVHSRFWKALERLDTAVQPSHVRRAWDGMLAEEDVERVRAEAQGVTEVVEPPKVSVCAKCGTTLGEIACVSDMVDGMFCSDRCRKVAEVRAALKEDSVAASATDGPTGVEAPPPLPPPVGPPPGALVDAVVDVLEKHDAARENENGIGCDECGEYFDDWTYWRTHLALLILERVGDRDSEDAEMWRTVENMFNRMQPYGIQIPPK